MVNVTLVRESDLTAHELTALSTLTARATFGKVAGMTRTIDATIDELHAAWANVAGNLYLAPDRSVLRVTL